MCPLSSWYRISSSIRRVRAQNNDYGIDDECYRYSYEGESLIDKDEFDDVNRQLLETAVRKGDEKARTLYYVARLKHVTAKKPADDAEAAVGTLGGIPPRPSRLRTVPDIPVRSQCGPHHPPVAGPVLHPGAVGGLAFGRVAGKQYLYGQSR